MNLCKIRKFSREQLLKLLAIMILSDGNLHLKNKKLVSLRLITTYNSKDAHLFFKWICKKLYKKEPNFYISKDKFDRRFNVSELYCSIAVEELLKLSPSYKTTPSKDNMYLKLPQPTLSFLLHEKKEFIWTALGLYFDFDGSIVPSFKLRRKTDIKNKKKYKYYQVQFECEISIAETNPSIINDLVKIFNFLKIKSRIKKDKRNWNGLQGISISEFNSVRNFIIKRNFLIDMPISKSRRFYNINKQSVCEAILNLLDDDNFITSRYFDNYQNANQFRIKSVKKLLKYIKTPK